MDRGSRSRLQACRTRPCQFREPPGRAPPPAGPNVPARPESATNQGQRPDAWRRRATKVREIRAALTRPRSERRHANAGSVNEMNDQTLCSRFPTRCWTRLLTGLRASWSSGWATSYAHPRPAGCARTRPPSTSDCPEVRSMNASVASHITRSTGCFSSGATISIRGSPNIDASPISRRPGYGHLALPPCAHVLADDPRR